MTQVPVLFSAIVLFARLMGSLTFSERLSKGMGWKLVSVDDLSQRNFVSAVQCAGITASRLEGRVVQSAGFV